jgi:hypothetical protein
MRVKGAVDRQEGTFCVAIDHCHRAIAKALLESMAIKPKGKQEGGNPAVA